MLDLIIKGGTVVTAIDSFLCDVGVKDGKIVEMAVNPDKEAKEVVDASGKLLWMYIHIWLCLLAELFRLTVICQEPERQPVEVLPQSLITLFREKVALLWI